MNLIDAYLLAPILRRKPRPWWEDELRTLRNPLGRVEHLQRARRCLALLDSGPHTTSELQGDDGARCNLIKTMRKLERMGLVVGEQAGRYCEITWRLVTPTSN